MNATWEQLLYSSVDHIIDGQERSGWQIKESSPGLEDDEAAQLVELIEPRLVPLLPLAGFPSAEEIAVADRRLVHRSTPIGSVLIHTAPAGQDTTGRPNTMTHVVLSRHAPTTRALLAADSWRARWWVTPFGAAQVRGSTLPHTELIGPGVEVTFDTAAQMILQPGGRAVLTALADTIASSASLEEGRSMAVLSVRSIGEAARWIDALLRTCAPEAARHVDWSLFQRVGGLRDLVDLYARGFDIVCVPAEDLAGFSGVPDGCVLVDAVAPPVAVPTTSFGRFVQAMTADLASWVSSLEAIGQVIEQLSDQTGASLEWAIAMAQACTPGLLDPVYSGDLSKDVDVALIGAGVPIEVMSRYVAAVFDERLKRIGLRTPRAWYELFATLPEGLEPTAGTTKLARSYLESAVEDPAWLLRATHRPTAPVLQRSITAWSAAPAHREALLELIEKARPHVHEAVKQARPDALENITFIVVLQAEGLKLPTRWLREQLAAVAELASRDPAEAAPTQVSALSAQARALLAQQLEPYLAQQVRSGIELRVQPQLSAEMTEALLTEVDTSALPVLDVQRELHRLAHQRDSAPALRALTALTAEIRLAPEVLMDLAAALRPRELPLLETSGIVEWEPLAADVLSRDPRAPESAQWARQRVRSSPALHNLRAQLVSPEGVLERVVVLVMGAGPLLTRDLHGEQAGYLALNVVRAAEAGSEQRGEHPSHDMRALHRLATRRAEAAAVLLEASRRYPSGPHAQISISESFLAGVPRWSETSPDELVAPDDAPLGQIYMDALACLLSTMDRDGAGMFPPAFGFAGTMANGGWDPSEQMVRPDDSMPGPGISSARQAQHLRRAACLHAAPMILDARIATLPQDEVARVRQEIIETLQLDSKHVAMMERLVPRLGAVTGDRATSIVQKMKRNLMPWQHKEGHDG